MWPTTVISRTSSALYRPGRRRTATVTPKPTSISIKDLQEDERVELESEILSFPNVATLALGKERRRRNEALKKPYATSVPGQSIETTFSTCRTAVDIRVRLFQNKEIICVLTCNVFSKDSPPTYAILRRMINDNNLLHLESRKEAWFFVSAEGTTITKIQEPMLRPVSDTIFVTINSDMHNMPKLDDIKGRTENSHFPCSDKEKKTLSFLEKLANLYGHDMVFLQALPEVIRRKDGLIDIRDVCLFLRHKAKSDCTISKQLEKDIMNIGDSKGYLVSIKCLESHYGRRFSYLDDLNLKQASNSKCTYKDIIEGLQRLEKEGFVTILHVSELDANPNNRFWRVGDAANIRSIGLQGKITRVNRNEEVSIRSLFDSVDSKCTGCIEAEVFIKTFQPFIACLRLVDAINLKYILRKYMTPENTISYRALLNACFPNSSTSDNLQQAILKLRKTVQNSSFGGVKLRKAFQQFDPNGQTGKIKVSEFSCCLENLKLGLTKSEIHSLLDKFDPQYTNTITYTQFAAFCENGVGRWANISLLIDEFVRSVRDLFFDTKDAPNTVDIDAAFKFFDLDGDEYISIDEMANGLENLKIDTLQGLHRSEVFRLMEASGSLLEINTDGLNLKEPILAMSIDSFRGLLKQGEFGDVGNFKKKGEILRKTLHKTWQEKDFREIFNSHFDSRGSSTIELDNFIFGARKVANVEMTKEQGFKLLTTIGTRDGKVTFQDFIEFIAPCLKLADSHIISSIRRTLRKRSLAGIALRRCFNRSFNPNKEGEVTIKQFKTGVRNMGFDISDSQMYQLLRAFTVKGADHTLKTDRPDQNSEDMTVNFRQFVCFVLAGYEEGQATEITESPETPSEHEETEEVEESSNRAQFHLNRQVGAYFYQTRKF